MSQQTLQQNKQITTSYGRKLAEKLSFGEEIGNAVSHGVMAAILLLVLPLMAVYGYLKGGVIMSIGFSIVAISLFLMFLASTLYHSMSYDSPHKIVFRILDHIFIYVAIAGTFTPIVLVAMDGVISYLVLIIQWGMVLFGILYKSIAKNSLPKVSVTIYMAMGWSAILLIPQLIANTSPMFIGLIVLGGLLYTVGALFYRQKKPWRHFIWHLFINAASISHLIAIIFYL
ncbi:MAG: hemolysin III family protein [Erysipelothrix sp.]|nr:hemolysin III family protein [Erysipelothrix sp.]